MDNNRWNNMAQVRLVVADTEEAQRRSDAIDTHNRHIREGAGGNGHQNHFAQYVRNPMHIEVSSDGGKTWATIPTQGGTEFVSSQKGDMPRATIDIPIMSGLFGPGVVPAELPDLPEGLHS